MPDNRSTAVDQTEPNHLVSFLKAIPDGGHRHGVRYAQWFLQLLVTWPLQIGPGSMKVLIRPDWAGDSTMKRTRHRAEPGCLTHLSREIHATGSR